MKRYNKENPEKVSEWDKNHPEKAKERAKRWYLKNKGKYKRKWNEHTRKRHNDWKKEYRKNNPEMEKAQKLAEQKIQIPKDQLCGICKINQAVIRHHPDYNKPLEVEFLCAGCHYNVHNPKI